MSKTGCWVMSLALVVVLIVCLLLCNTPLPAHPAPLCHAQATAAAQQSYDVPCASVP